MFPYSELLRWTQVPREWTPLCPRLRTPRFLLSVYTRLRVLNWIYHHQFSVIPFLFQGGPLARHLHLARSISLFDYHQELPIPPIITELQGSSSRTLFSRVLQAMKSYPLHSSQSGHICVQRPAVETNHSIMSSHRSLRLYYLLAAPDSHRLHAKLLQAAVFTSMLPFRRYALRIKFVASSLPYLTSFRNLSRYQAPRLKSLSFLFQERHRRNRYVHHVCQGCSLR